MPTKSKRIHFSSNEMPDHDGYLMGTAPILITNRNCEAAFGIPWSGLRALANELGVQPLLGLYEKRIVYRAIDLVIAINAKCPPQPAPVKAPTEQELIDAELLEIGLGRRSS